MIWPLLVFSLLFVYGALSRLSSHPFYCPLCLAMEPAPQVSTQLFTRCSTFDVHPNSWDPPFFFCSWSEQLVTRRFHIKLSVAQFESRMDFQSLPRPILWREDLSIPWIPPFSRSLLLLQIRHSICGRTWWRLCCHLGGLFTKKQYPQSHIGNHY